MTKLINKLIILTVFTLLSYSFTNAQNAQELGQLADDLVQTDGNNSSFIQNNGVVHYKDGTTAEGIIRLQIGIGYKSIGMLQLILPTKMKPEMIYPSDVTYVEIGLVKFFPLKIKDDKGKYVVFAAGLSKNLDDKMGMFRLYKNEINNTTTGQMLSLNRDYAVLTAGETTATILGSMGGTLGITPFNKYMSSLVEACPELAKKVKNKDDGYKVSLIDLKNKNSEVYFKILDEYNACK
jgi:hypothetical protein